MSTANFEIGNKEFEVRFIRESGYPPTKNERGSSLIETNYEAYSIQEVIEAVDRRLGY